MSENRRAETHADWLSVKFKRSSGTDDLTHTFETSRGSLPEDKPLVLQIPVFAMQVLFAKHLAVL